MKETLVTLFKKESTITRYGTIIETIDPRRYRIEDEKGFKFIVQSTKLWGNGTKVIVQNNMIIGTGKRSGDFKSFEV